MYCENGSRQGKYGGGHGVAMYWGGHAETCGNLFYAMGVSANSVASVKSANVCSVSAVVQSPRQRRRSFERGRSTAIIITSATSHLCRCVVWRIAHSLFPAVCNQITCSAPFEKDGSMPFSVMLVKVRFQRRVIKSHLRCFSLRLRKRSITRFFVSVSSSG